jgi:actin-related protein
MFIPAKSTSSCGIPIIHEFGSLNTRAGFAGKDRSDAVVPSVLSNSQPSTLRMTRTPALSLKCSFLCHVEGKTAIYSLSYRTALV